MVDPSPFLAPWSDVAKYTEWTGLLVGNGASMAIWPQFNYTSLFDVAGSNDVAHPLTASDKSLFDAFNTTNFEHVLASLKTAGVVARALDLEARPMGERYESVQRALFEAVHAVHVPWDHVVPGTIPRLFEIFRQHRFVYSTNYDLLLYWASMHNGGKGFLDYFWGADTAFALSDTDIWLSRDLWTRVLFLHGGIHLRRLQSGGTRKATAAAGSLLDQFSTEYGGEESPLLISEGESVDKLGSIRSSDYLTFAYQTFSGHEGGLVIFGHSLGEQDEHLVEPMRSWRGNPIAIAMQPNENEELLIQRQDMFRSRLSPVKDVVFFDSTTHPLGDPGLVARAPRFGLFRR